MTTDAYADDLKRGSPNDDAILDQAVAWWGYPRGPQLFRLYLELFNRRRTTYAMEHGFFGTYYSEVQNRELFNEITPAMRKDYLYAAFRKGQNLYAVGQTVDRLQQLLNQKLFGATRPTWVKKG